MAVTLPVSLPFVLSGDGGGVPRAATITLGPGLHTLRFDAVSGKLTLHPISVTVQSSTRTGTATALSGAATLGAAAASRTTGAGVAATLLGIATLWAPYSTRASSGAVIALVGSTGLSLAIGRSSLSADVTGTATSLTGASSLSSARGWRDVRASPAFTGASTLSNQQGYSTRRGAASAFAGAATLSALRGTDQAFTIIGFLGTVQLDVNTTIVSLDVTLGVVTLELLEGMMQGPFGISVPRDDGELHAFQMTLNGQAIDLTGRTVTLTVKIGATPTTVTLDCPVNPDGKTANIHLTGALTATVGTWPCAIRVTGGGDDPHTRSGNITITDHV